MRVRLPEALIKELDALMERMRHGEVEERQAVVARLTDYERSGTIPLEALIEMADEDDPTAAMYAVGALGRSQQPAAVIKLLALAGQYRERHPMFTETVVDALGEAGDKAATKVLLDFLGVKRGWRGSLLGLLGKLRKKQATEQEKAFRAYIVLPAIRALAKLADRRAAEALGQYLNHEDPLVRWHAIQGIVKCGRTEFIPRLERMGSNDSAELIREAARIAVQSMQTPPPEFVN